MSLPFIKSTWRGLIGSGLLFFLCANASGGTNSSWFARPWQLDDGLPHNNITGISQTADGFLWLGTPVGLVNFDGVRFQKFTLTNSIYGDNRGVLGVLKSRRGGLWVSLDRGAIAYLNGSETRLFTHADGLRSQQSRQLMEDGDGALWLVFPFGRVQSITGDHVITWPQHNELPDNGDLSLACDIHGTIWWGKDREIGKYEDGKFQQLAQLTDGVSWVASARDGGVWAVTYGTHLWRCDAEGKVTDCGAFAHNQPGRTTVLCEDSRGAVWIGTPFAGLFRYDGKGFENIPLARPQIQSVFEDRENNIWVGTLGGGLYRVRPRVVQLEGTDSGLPYDVVRSLCEDTKSNLWAITDNGLLSRHVGNSWVVVTNQEWAGEELTCVAADDRGALWIGTSGGVRKLHRFEDDKVSTFEGLTNNTVLSLLASSQGDVWIGGVSSLQRLRGGVVGNIKLPSTFHTIRAMAEDSLGGVWIGSARGEMLRATKDEIIPQQIPEADPVKSIRCMTTLPDGSLWMGFAGLGAGRIKDGHYARLGTDRGLADDYISQIVPDQYGWLWFGSDRGIFKVRQKEMEDALEGKTDHVHSFPCGRGEGLANAQVTFGTSPGAIRSSDGRIWMPTRLGLAVIDPAPQPAESRLPEVLFTRVLLDDQPIAAYRDIMSFKVPANDTPDLKSFSGILKLPPNYRRLEIDFTSLSFVGIENIRFRYRLAGLEKDWTEVQTEERAAKYSRLPAGEYHFEVAACNSDGVWNETGPVLAITVLPYFWQTWWFITTAGILLLGVAVGGARYVEKKRARRELAELERERMIERERTRIAKDIHDDLGANLTEITLLSELAQSSDAPDHEVQSDVRRIATKARDLTHSLDEIVWAVNPRNDTLDSFVTYTCIHAEDYLRTAGIRCRLNVPAKVDSRALATNVRHNLFLVVKEALNNIVKHAAAAEVSISFAVEPHRLEIVIKDNGRGFDFSEKAGDKKDLKDHPIGGNGLVNMRQRMEDIGGVFDLQSGSVEGTTIKLVMHWPEH